MKLKPILLSLAILVVVDALAFQGQYRAALGNAAGAVAGQDWEWM